MTAAALSSWHYPRVIAHRCGGALAPENTLAGLQVARLCGVSAVEFDVMLSADGVPFVIHDETLERTTDGQGAVALTRAAQLRQLDAGVRHHAAFRGERLPLLTEMLAACHALGLAANAEIKPAAGHDAATGRVVGEVIAVFQSACLAAGKRPLSLLLSSFSEEALATALPSMERTDVGRAMARALLVENVPADWQTRLRRLDCQHLHCAATATEVTSQLAAELRASGGALACYTVNDAAQAAQLFAIGVSAIFTDRPDCFCPSAPMT